MACGHAGLLQRVRRQANVRRGSRTLVEAVPHVRPCQRPAHGREGIVAPAGGASRHELARPRRHTRVLPAERVWWRSGRPAIAKLLVAARVHVRRQAGDARQQGLRPPPLAVHLSTRRWSVETAVVPSSTVSSAFAAFKGNGRCRPEKKTHRDGRFDYRGDRASLTPGSSTAGTQGKEIKQRPSRWDAFFAAAAPFRAQPGKTPT